MIIITGATGALNGATLGHLLERVPPSDVAVALRDLSQAQHFTDLGVEVRHGDYSDAASLPGAFAGADQLLLISTSDPGVDAVALHRTAIDAAVLAGVGRILYTSHQGAALDSPFAPARSHAATEELLRDAGVAWTSLRNGYYAHTLLRLMGPWRDTGVITVPADGPVSWTSRDDVAEAAAVILASNGEYDGPTTLTAADALTFEEVAAIASEVAGRTVVLTELDEDAWITTQVEAGQPEIGARFTLGIYRAAQQGFFAGVDPLLGTLLGRKPATVRDVLTHVDGV